MHSTEANATLCIDGLGKDDKRNVFSFYLDAGCEAHVYNVRCVFVEGVVDNLFDGYDVLVFSDEPLTDQEVRDVYGYDARVIAAQQEWDAEQVEDVDRTNTSFIKENGDWVFGPHGKELSSVPFGPTRLLIEEFELGNGPAQFVYLAWVQAEPIVIPLAVYSREPMTTEEVCHAYCKFKLNANELPPGYTAMVLLLKNKASKKIIIVSAEPLNPELIEKCFAAPAAMA